MEDIVGFEFRPYDDELVGYYLRHQIEGNTRLVERAITEVKFYEFDPWNLPLQSKIKSKDAVWYFLSRTENKYAKGDRQNRTTRSGFWKLTGKPFEVKDKWGMWSGVRGRIGHYRCLVFHKTGDSEKTTSSDWVMHEFHYDLLPEHMTSQRTYVICRLEYKGDDMTILFDYPTDPTPTFVANATNSEGSMADRSFQETSGSFYYHSEYDSANQGQQFPIFNVQQEVPYSDSYADNPRRIWDYEVSNDLEFLFEGRTMMQTNRSNHCPKTPVTGVLTDDNSDSETDSMVINTQKRAEDSIKKTPSNNTVKHNWIVLQEMSQRNSQWNYLKNMIVGFLLLISIIGWIIVV